MKLSLKYFLSDLKDLTYKEGLTREQKLELLDYLVKQAKANGVFDYPTKLEMEEERNNANITIDQ